MFWDNFYSACLEKGIKPNPLAKELDIASGSMTTWKKGGIPNGETLIKLADYLDVSIDYLLGRTERPNEYYNNSFNIGNNSNQAVGNNNVITTQNNSNNSNSYVVGDKHDRELLEEYNKLSLKNKAKVINLITELEENDN